MVGWELAVNPDLEGIIGRGGEVYGEGDLGVGWLTGKGSALWV